MGDLPGASQILRQDPTLALTATATTPSLTPLQHWQQGLKAAEIVDQAFLTDAIRSVPHSQTHQHLATPSPTGQNDVQVVDNAGAHVVDNANDRRDSLCPAQVALCCGQGPTGPNHASQWTSEAWTAAASGIRCQF